VSNHIGVWKRDAINKLFSNAYHGFYNNIYIRSSYEYVYIKILEKDNIKFKTEEHIYKFKDGSTFKPDFYIYDDNDNFIKIVEIKAEDCTYYELGKQKVEKLKQEYGLNCELLSIKELRKLCRDKNMSFDKISKEWKQSESSSNIKDISGKNNPMYGRKQSKESKYKNGQKTKERFQKDLNFKSKHKLAVIDAMKKVDKNKISYNNRRKNKNLICTICNKEYIAYTSQSLYCDDCRNKYTKWQLYVLRKNK
jgi:hypothetical protein